VSIYAGLIKLAYDENEEKRSAVKYHAVKMYWKQQNAKCYSFSDHSVAKTLFYLQCLIVKYCHE
jgi:hypothetical protein